MSNYDGPSASLDNLRKLIIRTDTGLAPLDITMLGRVEKWLEATEMSLRAEQAKHIVRDTRVGQWPEEEQEILLWSDQGKWWTPDMFTSGFHPYLIYWLPAPKPPTNS